MSFLPHDQRDKPKQFSQHLKYINLNVIIIKVQRIILGEICKNYCSQEKIFFAGSKFFCQFFQRQFFCCYLFLASKQFFFMKYKESLRLRKSQDAIILLKCAKNSDQNLFTEYLAKNLMSCFLLSKYYYYFLLLARFKQQRF